MRNKPVGSLVGAIAGLVFVLVNAGAVPWTSRVAGGSRSWRRSRSSGSSWCAAPRSHPEPPSRAALRTYGISVTAMVVLIPVGASVITNVLEKPNAVVVWVVFVVGAHFVPFARAFDLPVFTWLAASMMLVAVVGRRADAWPPPPRIAVPLNEVAAAAWPPGLSR